MELRQLCPNLPIIWHMSFIWAALRDPNLYTEPTTYTLGLPSGDGSSRRLLLNLIRLGLEDQALEQLERQDLSVAKHLLQDLKARLQFFLDVHILAVEHRSASRALRF
jgi:hypothetical protein